MEVYERKAGSAGTINISVKPPEVEKMRDALAFLQSRQPHAQMSPFIVDLIFQEAARQGWQQEAERQAP